MRNRVPLLFCVLLVVALLSAPAPAAAQPDAEEVRFEVQLQDDGDARWTIVAVIDLEDEEEAEEFQSFAEAFEAGEQDFELGVDAFERAAAEAGAATGRDMEIVGSERNATVVTDTNGETGYYSELRVSFTWESFARVGENGTVRVDDAFNTTDGTWLPGLEEGQALVIKPPPGYGAPSTAPIGAEEGELRWEGPETFEPGYFEIEYQPPETAGPNSSGVSTALLAGAVLLSGAALFLGLYLLWVRRNGGPDAGADPESAAADPPPEATDGEAESEADEGGSPEASEEAAAGAEPDLELLSDEERVEYLLEQNGGRMKQADIVKETGWSNAKVSQLLSSMEEADRIDKLRIGRENLISLPDEGIGELDDGDAGG